MNNVYHNWCGCIPGVPQEFKNCFNCFRCCGPNRVCRCCRCCLSTTIAVSSDASTEVEVPTRLQRRWTRYKTEFDHQIALATAKIMEAGTSTTRGHGGGHGGHGGGRRQSNQDSKNKKGGKGGKGGKERQEKKEKKEKKEKEKEKKKSLGICIFNKKEKQIAGNDGSRYYRKKRIRWDVAKSNGKSNRNV